MLRYSVAIIEAIALSITGAAAQSLPNGGTVVAGEASIGSPVAGSLVVTQTTDRAIIDWNGFSIATGNSVQFDNGAGATLNRVTGANVSSIDGMLSATGSVYLINPNGVIIGKSGVVNVGGSFVASTLDVPDRAFTAGGDLTFAGDSGAAVINLGRVGALGGDVALLAVTVDNSGSITAPNGTVGLVAGHQILMRDNALDGGKFVVKLGGDDTSVSDAGSIAAAAAELRAEGGNVYALAGNTKGLSRASGVVRKGNRVFLSDGGDVASAATTPAPLPIRVRPVARPKGKGSVTVTGVITTVAPNGDGGKIAITGQIVDVGAGARLDASAVSASGNGGSITAIANMATGRLSFAGTALAQGGASGGNGGFVETSGSAVDFTGARVNTSAAYGSTGNWLTDPYDLTVDSAAAATINTNLATTNVTLQTTSTGTTGSGTANASGSGDIIVNSAITWSTTNTLTLDAYRNINVNAAVTASGGGKVVLITGDTANNGTSGSTTGDYSFGATTAGGTGTGNVAFTGGSGSGSTLSIGTGGSGAPASYTLLYNLTSGAQGLGSLNGKSAGNYALANTLSASSLGNIQNYFIGSFGGTAVFTGLGNTLTNLTLVANSNTSNVGLFSTNSGTIRDFGLPNASLIEGNALSSPTTYTISNSALLVGNMGGGALKNVYATGVHATTSNGNYIGGLVGLMSSGIISSSYSGVAVTDTTSASYLGGLVGNVISGAISNSYATGNITTTPNGYNAGGLVGGMGSLSGGLAGPTISNSYATGNLSVGSYAGGLVGVSQNSTLANPNLISNSYATGAVAAGGSNGGLMGSAGGATTIINSHATGNVTTANSNASVAGGLVGTTDGRQAGGAQLGVFINNSYATGNVTLPTGTSNNKNAGGLIGLANTFTTVNTSFATGNVTANNNVGGLIGEIYQSTTVNDAYATGAVTGNSYFGGLAGYINTGTSITNAYAAGKVTATGTSPSLFGGVTGSNGGTLTNVYYDSTSAGTNQTYAYGTTATGAQTTAQLENGAYPAGFNPSVWGVLNNIYPYLQGVGPAPAATASYQLISGTGYLADGVTAANGATINLYTGGTLLGTATANSSGVFAYNAPAGSVGATTPVGETLMLSGAPTTVVGASYSDTRTLVSGNVVGLNVTQSLFDYYTTQTTLSGLIAAAPVPFGTVTYNSVTSTLSSAATAYRGVGAFTVDATLTAAASLKVMALGGDLNVSKAFTFAGSNTLTLDAYANLNVNAVINVSGAGKVVLVTGDTAATGKSANATSDYSFGLTGTTFAGALSFTGGSGSGATLNIGTGGDNIAPSAYTILYSLATALATSGKYALATNITSTATANVYNSTASITYTGLGHTVSGLAMSTTTGATGFFGTLTGTASVRDLGVSGTVASTGTGAVGGLIGSMAAGRVKDTFSTVSVSGRGTGTGTTNGTGGLIGTVVSGGAVINSTATGTVAGAELAGGLIGNFNGASATVTGSHATGNVSANGSTNPYAGGLIGQMNGTGQQVTNSYATGSVSLSGGGQTYGGGLVGTTLAPVTISGSYATGNVTNSVYGVIGGLVGFVQNGITVASSYATGAVSGTGPYGQMGGLIGTTLNSASAITITNSYATGNVNGGTVSGGAGVGGLIGYAATTGAAITINTSFATGTVTATATADIGGLIGYLAPGAASTIQDVYAQGATKGGSGVGGLIGAFAGSATTIKNTYASGFVSGTTTGGLIGSGTSSLTVTNGYWDTTTSTQAIAGAGPTYNFSPAGPSSGGLTVGVLTNGTLPSGFNSGTTNGTPWGSKSGYYPYFSYLYPNGPRAITGHGYLTGGSTAAVGASVVLYAGGVALAGGSATTDSSGAYTALIDSGLVASTTPIGGTLSLSTSSAVVGASFTDTPTVNGSGDLTNFDITQGTILETTKATTDSVLQAEVIGAFGGSSLAAIQSALASATEGVRATGAFTVDDALSFAGGVTVQAAGLLTVGSTGIRQFKQRQRQAGLDSGRCGDQCARHLGNDDGQHVDLRCVWQCHYRRGGQCHRQRQGSDCHRRHNGHRGWNVGR